MTPPLKTDDAIAHIVRREGTRLRASLVASLGNHQLALAEDVTQEAILKALQTWQHRDVPRNPGAWLRRVAMNCAIDTLRRRARETNQVDEWPKVFGDEHPEEQTDEHAVEDAELRLLLLACHPVLSVRDQVILSLQLGAGFTAKEIASLLLQPTAAVAQRLVRLKRRLRDETPPEQITELSAPSLDARLPSLLQVLYLMFCAGYFPTRGELLMRDELMGEALRLAELVAKHWPERSEVSAMCALFHLQLTRRRARECDGKLVPLPSQDRALWDQAHLERAMAYLALSKDADELTRYHLEAAIALEHATSMAFEETGWSRIVAMYQQLHKMTASPVMAVSAALATHYGGDSAAALRQLDALSASPALAGYAPYYVALAEVSRAVGEDERAAAAVARAESLAQNDVVRAYLQPAENFF